MAYRDFKDSSRRTASDKILRDKTFNTAKNPKYDGYQRELASMVYKFFDKKSASSSGVTMLANESAANNEIKQNLQLAEELHKTIIRNFKKGRVYLRFKDSISDADLADMQSVIRLNKKFRFLLCVTDSF